MSRIRSLNQKILDIATRTVATKRRVKFNFKIVVWLSQVGFNVFIFQERI